jgi:hypothetical protein
VRILLLTLTTIRRLALPLFLFLAWTPAAYAWSWPVQGPVLQAFSYDEAHPYAAGQHRGVDIGADVGGETVVAPAAGTVSFAGTVSTNGKSVTIATADSYAVTLTHLGSILVAKGAEVGERDPIGTVGPSGTPEFDAPYLHLGIRHATDPNGYVDPLEFLPPASDPVVPSSSTSSPTVSSSAPSASTTAPAASTEPPASAPPASRTPKAPHVRARASSHARGRVQETRVKARSSRSPSNPRVQSKEEATAPTVRAKVARGSADERTTSASRRSVVETAAPVAPTGLDAGQEIQASIPVVQFSPSRRPISAGLLPLLLNGAAAGVALGAAFLVARRRRRRPAGWSPALAAPVLHLPHRESGRRPESRAA